MASGTLRPYVQGYLAHKNTPPPRTLLYAYAYGPMVVRGGLAFSYERGTPVGLQPVWGQQRPACQRRDGPV